MERRREVRHTVDQDVFVTDLSAQTERQPGRILNYSGKGMALFLRDPVPVNAAIQVEWEDNLLLGEVCYCRPDGCGARVGLQLEQILTTASDLNTLLRRLEEYTETPAETKR